ERRDPTGPHLDDAGRRASLKGFLSDSLEKYLELLDWTDRQIRSDKIGSIPKHLQPILTRIGLDMHGWCDIVVRLGRMFKRAAGSPEHLAEEASRRGLDRMSRPRKSLPRIAKLSIRKLVVPLNHYNHFAA